MSSVGILLVVAVCLCVGVVVFIVGIVIGCVVGCVCVGVYACLSRARKLVRSTSRSVLSDGGAWGGRDGGEGVA